LTTDDHGVKHLRDEVKFWVPLIILFVGIATSFAVLKAEVASLDKRHGYEMAQLEKTQTEGLINLQRQIDIGTAKCEALQTKVDPKLTEIQVQLTQVQTDLTWLRRELERQRSDD